MHPTPTVPELTLHILLQHNAWATRRILEGCSSLTEEQFHQRFDIGPGSLHDTLRHIIGAMLRWSDRISGDTLRPSPESDPRRRTVAELLEMLEEAHRSLTAVAEAIGDGGLEVEMTTRFGNGPELRFSKAAALVHATTHGMHHRAQALNMLRRLGHGGLVDQIDAIDWALEFEQRAEQP